MNDEHCRRQLEAERLAWRIAQQQSDIRNRLAAIQAAVVGIAQGPPVWVVPSGPPVIIPPCYITNVFPSISYEVSDTTMDPCGVTGVLIQGTNPAYPANPVISSARYYAFVGGQWVLIASVSYSDGHCNEFGNWIGPRQIWSYPDNVKPSAGGGFPFVDGATAYRLDVTPSTTNRYWFQGPYTKARASAAEGWQSVYFDGAEGTVTTNGTSWQFPPIGCGQLPPAGMPDMRMSLKPPPPKIFPPLAFDGTCTVKVLSVSPRAITPPSPDPMGKYEGQAVAAAGEVAAKCSGASFTVRIVPTNVSKCGTTPTSSGSSPDQNLGQVGPFTIGEISGICKYEVHLNGSAGGGGSSGLRGQRYQPIVMNPSVSDRCGALTQYYTSSTPPARFFENQAGPGIHITAVEDPACEGGKGDGIVFYSFDLTAGFTGPPDGINGQPLPYTYQASVETAMRVEVRDIYTTAPSRYTFLVPATVSVEVTYK